MADTVATPVTSKSTKQPTGSKRTRRHRDAEELALMRDIATSIQERNKRRADCVTERNAIDTFGKYISESLKQLDATTCTVAQQSINNILFQAQMGTLHTPPKSINAYPVQHPHHSQHPTTSFHVQQHDMDYLEL